MTALDLRTSQEKSAALEALKRLRSLLARVEHAVGHSHSGSQLQQHVCEWESLHAMAMEAVSASIPCERKEFRRRMSAEAALVGLRFD